MKQRVHSMSVTAHKSEVSGCCKQINGATMFYSFPHDMETVLRKGLNAICAFSQIGQRSISKSCDSNNGKLMIKQTTAHH